MDLSLLVPDAVIAYLAFLSISMVAFALYFPLIFSFSIISDLIKRVFL